MQLTELAADYQDEHSTSTQTAEMLEAETTERIRLDKEVKELQVFILVAFLPYNLGLWWMNVYQQP